jgi:hypothetical protein
MAKKPDGRAASVDRVSFTRPAAERIGKAVRQVEAGDRDLGPIEWGPRGAAASGKVFKVCTFTGAWAINTAKTVTFRNVTSTPNTVSAVNLFFPVTSTATAAVNCGIAKDGATWYLVDVPLQTATALFIRSTQSSIVVTGTATGVFVSSTGAVSYVTDISLSASLNTSSCSISIGKTLTTAAASVVTSTASATFVTGTATAVQVSETYTATYLRFDF